MYGFFTYNKKSEPRITYEQAWHLKKEKKKDKARERQGINRIDDWEGHTGSQQYGPTDQFYDIITENDAMLGKKKDIELVDSRLAAYQHAVKYDDYEGNKKDLLK